MSLIGAGPLLLVLSLVERCTIHRSYAKATLWSLITYFQGDFLHLIRNYTHSNTFGICEYCLDPNKADSKTFILTIDDSPGDDPELVHKVLDILKKYKAKATFFVTSDFVVDTDDGCKALMQRILAEGHELGNHCPKDIFYNRLSTSIFERELLLAEQVIEEVKTAAKSDKPPEPPGAPDDTKPVKLFRPPRGLISPAMVTALKKHRYQSILGSSFSNDPFVGGDLPPSETRTSQYNFAVDYHCEYNCKRILQKALRGQGGEIVIFHVPNKNNRRQTIFALDQLLYRLGNVGIRAVTVNQGYSDIKTKK